MSALQELAHRLFNSHSWKVIYSDLLACEISKCKKYSDNGAYLVHPAMLFDLTLLSF